MAEKVIIRKVQYRFGLGAICEVFAANTTDPLRDFQRKQPRNLTYPPPSVFDRARFTAIHHVCGGETLGDMVCKVSKRKTFLGDIQASMATQVVMFSVLLFGTSGVVLDFGRVYSEHSIMQTYTDQAALAAANELDQDIDSIDRAVSAVFGGVDADGTSFAAPLTRGVGWSGGSDENFNVSHLIFVSELGADTGAQTSLAGLQSDNIVYVAFNDGSGTGDRIAASLDARFVIAVAEERSVRNSLMQLINSSGRNAIGENNVVRTVSAAERRRQTCGDYSNLVICNPWENSDTDSFRSVMDDENNIGIQFAHIADGTNDERWNLMRRQVLRSQQGVNGICNNPSTMPGAFLGMSDELAETYNTICHLAAAQPASFCVGDQIAVIPIDAEELTTALSTAFDIWDEPINEVLTWDSDATGLSSVQGGFDVLATSSLRGASSLFQPDRNVYKGRVPLDRDDPADAAQIAENELAGIPESSRRWYKTNAGSSQYDLVLSACLRGIDDTSCLMELIGPPTTFTNVVEYYISNFFDHFVFVNGTAPPPLSLTSFYLTYLHERDNWFNVSNAAGTAAPGQSLAVTDEDASLALNIPGTNTDQLNNQANYTYGLNELNSSADAFDDDLERRRMSVTVINCGSIALDPADGFFRADIVDFIDLHLLQPPVPTCVGGGQDCANSALQSSRINTEYIGLTEDTELDHPILVR